MPDQRYDAQRVSVGTLLSTTSPRIEVPDWQRSYSWTLDEVEAFWQDLLAFDEKYPSQNIEGEEYFLGSAVVVTGSTTNKLLDGQQRLATATVLLSCLRDIRKNYRADAATRLQNKYIADFDDAKGSTTPVLTLNVYDRDYFRGEVQNERRDDEPRPKPQLRSHLLIQGARDYFLSKVSDAQEAVGGGQLGFERNLRLQEVLCNHFSIVVVSSTDEDNAAAVFETLNERGIGLSTPDLLRNLLLRKAADEDERSRIVSAWQVVLGISDEASIEEFLRHYWVSNRGDVKSRKLYREIKDAVTEESLDALDLSIKLAEAAPVYREIVRARDSDRELQRVLESVRALGAKTMYPLLMAAYAVADRSAKASVTEREKVRHELHELGQAAIALFVRYSVVAGRESTVLEATVFSAAARLRETGDFADAVESLRQLAPSAEEFIARFKRVSISRIATARYILTEIEHAKRATNEITVSPPDRVHVEHIYPQTPASDRWKVHAQLVNRIGNLSLLGRRLNTSIKNGGFTDKKVKGYANSDLVLTQELLAYDQWSPAEIDSRQDELATWVFQIWRFPGEEEPPENAGLESDGIALEELPEVPE